VERGSAVPGELEPQRLENIVERRHAGLLFSSPAVQSTRIKSLKFGIAQFDFFMKNKSSERHPLMEFGALDQ
jgi:hypothetical protein